MTQRTKFAVRYDTKLARFSDFADAMMFAHSMSWGDGLVEVSDATGLVGQFASGKSTPQFERNWLAAACFEVQP